MRPPERQPHPITLTAAIVAVGGGVVSRPRIDVYAARRYRRRGGRRQPQRRPTVSREHF